MNGVDIELSPGSPGGVFDLDPRADLDAIAAAAAERGARVVTIDGPSSRNELLDMLAEALEFPSWFGRNWDALDELLRYPDPPVERATVVIWDRADRLEGAAPTDVETAREVFASAAQTRNEEGTMPLVLLIRSGANP